MNLVQADCGEKWLSSRRKPRVIAGYYEGLQRGKSHFAPQDAVSRFNQRFLKQNSAVLDYQRLRSENANLILGARSLSNLGVNPLQKQDRLLDRVSRKLQPIMQIKFRFHGMYVRRCPSTTTKHIFWFEPVHHHWQQHQCGEYIDNQSLTDINTQTPGVRQSRIQERDETAQQHHH